jgi:flagellar basal-body rod protein FlgB
MFEKLNILSMAKRRMDWVAQRQEVLAQNIANADTPNYRPGDVKPFDFKAALQGTQQPAVAATVTSPLHVTSQPVARPYEVVRDRVPYETSPDGNQVVLEEQMLKVNEARSAYDVAASLFQKHVRMIRTAIGRNG